MEWTEKHPVSNVMWVPTDEVFANDYNPNAVAPPEMALLKISIESDGFTQPIVCWKVENGYEVVDGFHRHLVGKAMGMSHLPIVVINNDRTDRGDRIAATIRHNRARGKHKVTGMSEIVLELKRRNWSDNKIGRELGMDPDEVLRLTQITGLAEMFSDRSFSEAWEAESIISDVESLEVEGEDAGDTDSQSICPS
jgi:ParB-like chromosome segregation protein Spo0J